MHVQHCQLMDPDGPDAQLKKQKGEEVAAWKTGIRKHGFDKDDGEGGFVKTICGARWIK